MMLRETMWLGEWRENTLYLPSMMTFKAFDGVEIDAFEFPAPQCVVDASQLEEVDSVGVAALISLRAFADNQHVTLNWQHLPRKLTDLLDLYDINSEDMII